MESSRTFLDASLPKTTTSASCPLSTLEPELPTPVSTLRCLGVFPKPERWPADPPAASTFHGGVNPDPTTPRDARAALCSSLLPPRVVAPARPRPDVHRSHRIQTPSCVCRVVQTSTELRRGAAVIATNHVDPVVKGHREAT